MAELLCTGCSRGFPIDLRRSRCHDCGEPLEVSGPAERRGTVPVDVDTRALSGHVPLMQRFRDFLPVDALGFNNGDLNDDVLTLGEGNTPLLSLSGIGRAIGVPDLYVKVEGSNPTGSFKDRGSVVGVQRAKAAGFERVGTVSTGNMAGSVAAYAARAGLEAVVLVSASIPVAKLAPIAAYGPRLIGVEGDYGALYDLTVELGPELGIAFINSDDPFRVEGQKTLALELWLQFGRAVPDVVVVPVSSGGHMAALLKGFRELAALGLIDAVPRLVGVQATGCAPIAEAFARGEERPVRWGAAKTVAKAIANPTPPSGGRLLRAARTGAPLHFTHVSDDDILTAYHELMTEAGIFAQPDAAASVAAVKRLCREHFLTGTESVVAILTGHGTKDLTPLVGDAATPEAGARGVPFETCSLDQLASVLRE